MANALSDILKGAEDLAGNIYKGAVETGRRYTYGPYYERDQELREQQMNAYIAASNARTEAEKARKESYERDKDLNLAVKLYETMLLAGEEDKAEQIRKFIFSRWGIDTKSHSTGGTLGGMFNDIDKTALGMVNQNPNPSVFNQPQAGNMPVVTSPAKTRTPATSELVGPPTPPGYVNPQWFTSMPAQMGQFGGPKVSTEQTRRNIAANYGNIGAGTGSLTTLPAGTKITSLSPPGLEEIWDELEDEEKQTVVRLMKERGYTPEQLVKHFRSK